MKTRIKKLLLNLGIVPSILGYDYLVQAIDICYKDKTYLKGVTKILYPDLAKNNGTTVSRVERAIRYACESAFDHCPNIYEILIVSPSINKGKYTNVQFISACVEFLKLEDENA